MSVPSSLMGIVCHWRERERVGGSGGGGLTLRAQHAVVETPVTIDFCLRSLLPFQTPAPLTPAISIAEPPLPHLTASSLFCSSPCFNASPISQPAEFSLPPQGPNKTNGGGGGGGGRQNFMTRDFFLSSFGVGEGWYVIRRGWRAV